MTIKIERAIGNGNVTFQELYNGQLFEYNGSLLIKINHNDPDEDNVLYLDGYFTSMLGHLAVVTPLNGKLTVEGY